MAIMISSAEAGDDGVARLVARDSRLGLETVVYVTTDGNSWIFERNRHTAVEASRGRSGALPGLRIRHGEWEPIPDAPAAAAAG